MAAEPAFAALLDRYNFTALNQMLAFHKLTNPGGLSLTVNSTSAKAAFTRTVIVGSANTVSAPTPQKKGSKSYTFQSWSDGGAQTHTLTAPPAATTFTARFR